MSLYKELPIVFPWYEKMEQQYRNTENASQDCDYQLITPNDALLPFEFAKPIELFPVKWVVIDMNSNVVIWDLNLLGKVRLATKGGKDYIYYNGQKLQTKLGADVLFSPGYYYSRMEFTDGTFYYSEMFFAPAAFCQ